MVTPHSKSEVTANTCNLQSHMDISATDGAVKKCWWGDSWQGKAEGNEYVCL